ncbi:MAG: 4'-phosphopantetheinyl transferase superfamily protein [Candidatus Wildermuthbacteria bacterium]|nr:4'-phosphopantetheinyl transferase superfamily protein [Candidatus Wildermuthbacteria bacterium]
MNIKLGSDLVYIPAFEKALKANKEHFVETAFYPEEIEYAKVQRLASIFAAKEAAIKALGILPGKWLEIKILYEENGKPYIAKFPNGKKSSSKWKHELSISHDGEYMLANVIFYK